jgi:DNA-binding MarR family transcriptional regulator
MVSVGGLVELVIAAADGDKALRSNNADDQRGQELDNCQDFRGVCDTQSSSGPGQTLFAFVRHWARRSAAGDHLAAEQGRLVLVTEAVHSLTQRGIAATVNAVAREVGIDQSGASRLVKNATGAGYLAMQESEDGRRRESTVTSSGHTMLEQAHDWQEQVFDRLTEGWSEVQRRDFQQAMTHLINQSYTLDT